MMAGPIRLNRKYSILSPAICLGLVVVYFMYCVGELPKFFSGNFNEGSLR
jgi:hypothetical protein